MNCSLASFPHSYKAAPDYFEIMGLEILEGRGFSEADGPAGALVVVVNQSLARYLWPGEEVLGQCLQVGMDGMQWPPTISENVPCRSVVGVVSDTRTQRLREEQENTAYQYYVPFGQPPSGVEEMLAQMPRISDLLIRTHLDPAEAIPEIRRAVAGIVGPDQFLTLRAFQELLDPQIRPFRLGAALFTLFGLIALAMAAVGLYGILAYSVAQRRREIGVRIAMGADSAAVTRLVVGDGLKIALVGLLIGALAAFGVGRLLAAQLYRTSPWDPASVAGATLFLALAALAACWLPAWRASRLDPAVTLRED